MVNVRGQVTSRGFDCSELKTGKDRLRARAVGSLPTHRAQGRTLGAWGLREGRCDLQLFLWHPWNVLGTHRAKGLAPFPPTQPPPGLRIRAQGLPNPDTSPVLA